MQIIAVDLPFDAEADAVFCFLANRDVGAEFVRLAAQRFGDRMLQLGFRRRREPEQMRGRDVLC